MAEYGQDRVTQYAGAVPEGRRGACGLMDSGETGGQRQRVSRFAQRRHRKETARGPGIPVAGAAGPVQGRRQRGQSGGRRGTVAAQGQRHVTMVLQAGQANRVARRDVRRLALKRGLRVPQRPGERWVLKASNEVSTRPAAAREKEVRPLTFQYALTARVPAETRSRTSGRDPCQPFTSTASTQEPTTRTPIHGVSANSSWASASDRRRAPRGSPPNPRATALTSPDWTRVRQAASPMTEPSTQPKDSTSRTPSADTGLPPVTPPPDPKAKGGRGPSHQGQHRHIVSSVNDLYVGEARELLNATGLLRRTIRRGMRQVTQTEPLQPTQAELLRLAESRPGITVMAAAQEMRLAPNTVSTLVRALTDAELLSRSRGTTDGRTALLSITERARQRLAERRDLRAELVARALGRLTDADRQALLAAVPALLRLAEGVEADERAA